LTVAGVEAGGVVGQASVGPFGPPEVSEVSEVWLKTGECNSLGRRPDVHEGGIAWKVYPK
jgi:hypothetical protein